MTIKWKAFSAALLIYYSLSASASIPTKATTDITGNYRCRGDNILNTGKFDEPTVVTKTGETYHFIWQNKSVMFHGNAILLNNQLSIVYWVPVNPSDMGVVTYKVLPNGDLSGKWTTRDGQKTGNEYCEKIK